jgi:hypothetical protein
MKILSLIIVIIFTGVANAQSALTVRYMGLSIHPFGDPAAFLEPYKLDKKAVFVPNFGGVVAYEKFVWKSHTSIKIMQGAFADCSFGFAGVTHIGFRRILLDRKKHRLLFGMGQTFYYRDDWNRFPNYRDGNVFKHTTSKHFGDIQYRLFWYGCEFEYDYQLGKKLDLNVGFTPGAPLVMLLSVGIKYWINKDFRKKEKKLRQK